VARGDCRIGDRGDPSGDVALRNREEVRGLAPSAILHCGPSGLFEQEEGEHGGD
jgi:hypothetical protein